MLRSMTGFGRAQAGDEKYVFLVEIKAVNHRYLDISIRLPKTLNAYDNPIRQIIKGRLERGKVDIQVNYTREVAVGSSIDYNPTIVKGYLDCFSRMSNEFEVINDVRMSVLSRLPDVLVENEDDFSGENIWELLSKAVNEAVDGLISEREREGEKLGTDLSDKLKELKEAVIKIETIYPDILEEYTEKLKIKLQELLGNSNYDESRIIAESTLYADKICVDEETVRLKTHIDNMLNVLKQGGPCGKKLDFITQEMNRESNTILSKSNTMDITDIGISLKTGIEKVREQIQNIE